MNESAEESALECLSSPEHVSQHFVVSNMKPITKYHFAAIKHTYDFVPWGSVCLDLEKLYNNR